jgi:hypothetical protein
MKTGNFDCLVGRNMTWYTTSMRKHASAPFFYFKLLWTLCLSLLGGWSVNTGHAMVKVSDESIAGAPLAPPPMTWESEPLPPPSSGLEQRLLGHSLSPSKAQKKRFRLSQGPGLSLKSPGKLPGIELGVEMHSVGALQSMVPAERMPRVLNFQQQDPLLLPPSNNLSPDYNGGFLRFTW